jgi:hypothetical protein
VASLLKVIIVGRMDLVIFAMLVLKRMKKGYNMKVVFQCDLNGETVYVTATDLNGLISAGPNDLMFYTGSDNCQGQCKKKELTFLDIHERSR